MSFNFEIKYEVLISKQRISFSFSFLGRVLFNERKNWIMHIIWGERLFLMIKNDDDGKCTAAIMSQDEWNTARFVWKVGFPMIKHNYTLWYLTCMIYLCGHSTWNSCYVSLNMCLNVLCTHKKNKKLNRLATTKWYKSKHVMFVFSSPFFLYPTFPSPFLCMTWPERRRDGR